MCHSLSYTFTLNKFIDFFQSCSETDDCESFDFNSDDSSCWFHDTPEADLVANNRLRPTTLPVNHYVKGECVVGKAKT